MAPPAITYLDPDNAVLHNTPIICKGSVVNIHGQGHVIDLDVDIANGRLEDLLALGRQDASRLHERRHCHPRGSCISGPVPSPFPKSLRSRVASRCTPYTSQIPRWQDKVDDLSLRAQGRPGEANPGAPDVALPDDRHLLASTTDRIDFNKLKYTLPGAHVELTGLYSLDGEQFDFHGTVKTEASVSQMVKFLVEAVAAQTRRPVLPQGRRRAPKFPLRITGTHNEPKFGLDFHHKDDQPNQPKPFKPTINRQY